MSVYEMSVYEMSVYEMYNLWNVQSIKCSMKCLPMKCPNDEVLSKKFPKKSK